MRRGRVDRSQLQYRDGSCPVWNAVRGDAENTQMRFAAWLPERVKVYVRKKRASIAWKLS